MQRLLPKMSTHKSWLFTGAFVLLLLVLFFCTSWVSQKIYLFDYWPSTGQIIIFQYPSMLDEKNNGFTALTSYQNIQKVTC